MADHAEKTGKSGSQLPEHKEFFKEKGGCKYRKSGFNDVNQNNRPCDQAVSVNSLKIGESGVFASEVTNVLMIKDF